MVCLTREVCREVKPEQELWSVLQQRGRRSAGRRASGSGEKSRSAIARGEISGFRSRLKFNQNSNKS